MEHSRTRRGLIKGALVAATSGAMAGPSTAPTGERGIGGFDHVAVPLRNASAMAAFYRALGLTVNETDRVCSVHFGDQKINFHQPALWKSKTFTLRASAAKPPCGDFCFVWEGSMDSLRVTLKRARADIEEGPVERTGGRAGGTVGMSVYVRDPDGNLVEFILYP